jgi:hypothetical protein
MGWAGGGTAAGAGAWEELGLWEGALGPVYIILSTPLLSFRCFLLLEPEFL